MHTSSNTHQYSLKRAVVWMVLGCFGVGGCATNKAELKQEIEVLLKQTRDELKVETRRMDADMEQIKAEIIRLRSDVGHVEAIVGRVETHVSHIGSEVSLLQAEAEKSDTALVDLVVRMNQLDRRMGKADKPAGHNGDQLAGAADDGERTPNPALATTPMPPERVETSKALQYGMTEQDVLRLFGNPHGIERVMDSVYWYYGDGDLQGEYVKFDAKSGRVSDWSTTSPQPFQLDLRKTQRGHVQP